MTYFRAAIATRPRSRRRRHATRLARSARKCGRALRARWRRARPPVQIAICALAVIALWVPVNLVYQIVRKPTELLAPFSDALIKTPAETWRQYGPLFRRYATPTVSPVLLAALAQVESAGDPTAETYWRWQFSWNPFSVYGPASSAVGMFQMTDGAFAAASRYCIRDHRALAARSGACSWLGFYSRLLPSDATELAAAYLDRTLAGFGERHRLDAATPRQRADLAALVHLCGAGPAERYLRRDFRLAPSERCGDEDPARYLARVDAARRRFLWLAKRE